MTTNDDRQNIGYSTWKERLDLLLFPNSFMNATEVLNRYARGERDFRRANLRGQNFKGQDLSEADFSETDIRGTNFSNAILKGANFTEARAGIQRSWWWVQQTLAFFLSALAGFLSAFSGALIASLLFDTGLERTTSSAAGVLTLGLVAVMFGVIARQGFTAKAFSTIAVVVTVVVAVVVAVAGAGVVGVAFAGAVAVVVAVVFVVAVAVVIAFAGAVAVAGVVAFAVAGAVVVGVAFAFAVAGAVAIAVAIASFLVAIHCNRCALKGDERFVILRVFGVAFGAIGGTSFCGADLTHANFSHALLKRANFNHTRQRQTILEWVNWQGVRCLDRARVGNSMLANPAVRELLITREGSYKSYIDANLRASNLDGVNLEGANLTWADLSCATLHYANLKDANLSESLVLHTDFTTATLTGACLEAWNIDSQTILDQVDCQYVYLLRNQQERRPSSGDFAPGEFTKLFQEVLNTVDLIFRNGVDWKAFVAAFKQVQVENQDTPLEIQSIENKGDGVIVVRVNVPPETDKAKIHSEFNQQYELALKALEAKYQTELKAKEGEIAIYREQSANMWAAINSLASRPVNIINENTLMNNSTDQSQNVTIGGSITGSIINLGKISGNVSNVVNQLPSSPDPKQPGIKELLAELQATIESDADLPDKGKATALEQVKVLAEVAQNPEQPEKKSLGSQTINVLKGAASFLPDTAKLAEACSKLLPLITKALGLPF